MRPANSHWCNLRDLGPPGGVPSALAFYAYAQKHTLPPCNHGWLQALLPPDSCVLRPDGDAKHRRRKSPWGAVPSSRYCLQVSEALQDAERMEAVRSHAMRDLIASNAPLREGTHKARPAYTKPLTPGDSRGRSPLARLSPLSFVVQRKMESPKGVSLVERSENP